VVDAGDGRGPRVSPALEAIGERLRAAREAKGWTLADVEAATHIRAAYLEALEEGWAGRLPAEVYLRGFLRAYADHLGLDGAALVEEYKAATGQAAVRPSSPGPAVEVGPPVSRAERPRSRSRARRAARRATGTAIGWFVVALLVVGAGWGGFTLAGRWLAGHRAAHRVPAHPSHPATSSSPSAAHPTSSSASASSAGPASSSASSTPSTSAAGSAAAGPAQVQSRNTAHGWVTTYRLAAPRLDVRVTATGRIWIRRWVDGSSAFHDVLLTPGSTAVWHARRTLELELGNTHLTIQADGQTLPPLPSQDANPEWVWIEASGARA
jgi:cytoskeletal protein RodZ